METPKYALPEHERRFLVHPDRLPLLAAQSSWLIVDRYLDVGRLRLRAMTDPRSGERILKLCKKYVSGNPVSAPIVNIYLAEDEYAALATLPAAEVRKERFRAVGESGYSVDLFAGALAGLVLAEIELADPAAVRAAPVPRWVVREVTDDPFFTGGCLARTNSAALARHLAAEFAPAAPGTER